LKGFDQESWDNENSRFNRTLEYPPIGDQLDAILKYFDTVTDNLHPELEEILNEVNRVKTKYPLAGK
jgi:hypothetical protein